MPIYYGSSPIGEVNVSFTSPDGGTNTNDASLVSSNQLLNGVTAYSKGKKITGSIPIKTESNLTATDNIVNVPAGYYASACSKEIATIDFPEKEMAVDDSGLISCISNLTTGGFLSAGQKTTTLQLPVESGKTITPSSIEQTAVAAHKYTTGAVKVAAVPTETKTISTNGSYSPTSGKFFSEVVVNVPAGSASPVLQEKTITPIETVQEITPDTGYDGLSKVSVGAIAADYIGSGVIRMNALSEEEIAPCSSWAQATGLWLFNGGFSLDSPLCLEAGVTAPVMTEMDQKLLLATLGHDEMTFSNSLTDEEQAAIFTNPMTGATPACNLLIALFEGKFKQAVLIKKEYKATISDDEKHLFAASFLGSDYQTWQTAESIVNANKDEITDRNLAMFEYALFGYDGETDAKYRLTKGLWFDPRVDMPAMRDDLKQTILGTATPAQVLRGVTFSSGNSTAVGAQTGTLVVQKYYTGASIPSASLGNDGDIYFVTQQGGVVIE